MKRVAQVGRMRMASCAVLLVLAGCTTDRAPGCLDLRGRPMLVADLFFGRNVPNRAPVSDAEWSAFVQEIVTPRFSNGLTASDAVGQWYDARTQQLDIENTKHVVLADEDSPATLARLDEVIAAYKQLFDQRSVGMIIRRACAAFD